MKRLLTYLLLLISFAANARNMHLLNDDWRIFPASKSSGDDAYTVALPHCWGYDPITPKTLTNANYLRTIYAPQDWRERRVFLKFYGVQSISDLFVNGEFVGEHRGGSTAFCFEITNKLDFGEDNTLFLRVSSAPQNDLLPTSIEHNIYGGVYRDVELIVTPRVAISPIFYASDGLFVTTRSVTESRIEGDVRLHILSPTESEVRVEIAIRDMDGVLCHEERLNKVKIAGDQAITIPFSSKKLRAWSPTEPNLYRVTAKITQLNEPEDRPDKESSQDVDMVRPPAEDEVSVVSGFRVISLPEQTAENRALRINGEPYQLRGVSLYHDHPIEGGVLSSKIHKSDMKIIRDMGANAIRSAITPHDQALYEICDREGVAVWIDTPLARSSFFSDVAYFPTARFENNGLEQMREVVYQNYNHPSVMMWGIFSLMTTRGDDSQSYIERLNSEAKSIDATRPTVAISNQNGALNEVSDLIVWLQNIGWDKGSLSDVGLWQNLIHNRWGYLRSGVMFGEKGLSYHQIERSAIPMCRMERRKGWYPEVRQTQMHEEYMKYLSCDTLFWGMWSPAMFDFRSPRSDIGESATGFVSFDRTTRKDSYYLYRALWSRDRETLHIADRRSRMVSDSLITLRVYASDTVAPMAYIRNEEREMRRVAPAQYVLDSVLIRRRTKILVSSGNLIDSVEFVYGSPLKAREH